MIYKNDNGFDVAAMSDNERYLAVTQTLTTSLNNIFLVDQQTKQTKKINPDSPETNNYALTFSKDNNSLFLITDDGSEFSYLVKYDIATGKKEKVYELQGANDPRVLQKKAMRSWLRLKGTMYR